MKNRTLILVIVLFSCVFLSPNISAAVTGDGVQRLFHEGNETYKSGNYEKAIEIYRNLVEQKGVNSPELHYNLGNAYFKDNKPGYAIYHYEKAHRLLPRDGDIRYNLNFVRKAASRNLDLSPSDGLEWLGNICSINELTLITSLFYFLFSILFIAYVFFKMDKYFWALCTSGFLFLFFSFFLSLAIYHNEALHYGIVVAPSAEVRTGPSLSESVSSIIPDGTVVRIGRTEEGWSEIHLKGSMAKDDPSSRSVQGWVPDQDLKRLE
jgi:hypothetical protein